MALEDAILWSSIAGNVLEVIVVALLVFWFKFDKKQAKKRKPRAKKSDVSVTIPTLVKVQNGDEDES